MMAMLEVQNLSVNYRGIRALEDVSLSLLPGELVGLIGPNGAGKSTLIKAILGLAAGAGQVLFRGRPLHRHRQHIAYVPQRSQIDWDYPITAWNVVMMAQTTRLGWFRSPDAHAKQRVTAALERVDMMPLRRRSIGELSGGQQQRVFLARALAQEADLFLLDEPLTGVDKKTEAMMLDLFAELKAQGKTLLVCSHEWGEALLRYDRLLLLNRRLIANDAPQSVMTIDNIQQAYGDNIRPSLDGKAEMPFFC
jgi:manganese/iron transport system ATP-binding protein